MNGPANTTEMGDTGLMAHLPGHAPLTAQDRCDRCGARACTRAILASGSELLFCGHHGREHAPKLKPKTVFWYDETEPAVVPAQR